MRRQLIMCIVIGSILLNLVGCNSKSKATTQSTSQTATVQQEQPKQEQPKQLSKEEQKKIYLDKLYKINTDIGLHKRDIEKLEEQFDRVIGTPDLLNYHVEKIKEDLNEFKKVQPYEEYKEQYDYYIQGVQYYIDIYTIEQDYASRKIDIRNNQEFLNKIKPINDKTIASMNRAWDKIPLSGKY